MSKHSKGPPARRQFERATLRKMAEAGATHEELATARFLLTKGRKTPADDYCAALNKSSQEKAGIEFVLRALRGEPPDFVILNRRSVPSPSYHG